MQDIEKLVDELNTYISPEFTTEIQVLEESNPMNLKLSRKALKKKMGKASKKLFASLVSRHPVFK